MNLHANRKEIILIVNGDILDAQTIGEMFIAKSEFDIAYATAGKQALQIAKKICPDLIISDAILPGLDDFEIVSQLQSQSETQDIPVIFLIKIAELDDMIKGLEAGAVDCIARPFRDEELLLRVKTHLRLKQSPKITDAMCHAKSQFLADMSHEIRTPLNAILGVTELILHSELNEQHREQMEIIHTSSELLLSLIDDVLDLSKIEAGKMELAPVEFHLESMLKSVINMMDIKAREKNLKLTCRIFQNVSLGLIGDSYRLRQILINLVNHAIKLTETGEVRLDVMQEHEDALSVFLRFSVQGTGIGDPEGNHLANTRKNAGTGLGMAISKRLVEFMGGKIGVDRTAGKDSTFWFTLSLLKQRSIHKVTCAFESAPFSFDQNLFASRHILLAEDNELNAKLVTILLTRLGCSIDVAYNGKMALELLKINPYDLVLMDIRMPEMDGMEATRRIRDPNSGVLNPNIPIVALTAMAQPGDREACIQAGMNDYLAKPIRHHQFIRVMERQLSESSVKHVGSDSEDRHPSKETSTPPKIFDLRQLKDRLGDDQELIQTLITEIPKFISPKMDELKKACNAHDSIQIKFLAHNIKGMAGNISAQKMQNVAKLIELAGEKGDVHLANWLMSRLETEYADLLTALAGFDCEI